MKPAPRMPKTIHYANADPAYVQWEEEVVMLISEKFEADHGDSHGIFMGQAKAVRRAWENNHAPERAARDIIRAATPELGPGL